MFIRREDPHRRDDRHRQRGTPRPVCWLAGPSPAAFGVRVLLLWSPLTGFAVMHPLRDAVEEPLCRGYAAVTSFVLGSLGAAADREGAVLFAPQGGVAVSIVAECTGYFLLWLYAGAVLAFPTGWRQRLWGLAAGGTAIFALNVVRIAGLYVALGAWPGIFDELHLVVGQSAMVLAVVVIWYAWACRTPRPAPAA